MSRFSAVNTAIPILRSVEWKIIGNGQTCEHSIAELNLFHSNRNSRLRAAVSCRNVVKCFSVSGDSLRSFVVRATDPSNGSVLDAMTNSANHAAQRIHKKIRRAGELVTGTSACHSQASENRDDSENWEGQEPQENMHEQLDWLDAEEIHSLEEKRNSSTSENNAPGYTAEETINGAAGVEQEETEDEGFSRDFRAQTRSFQENVQEQAEEFVDSIRKGTSRVSEQLETAGRDLMHGPDHVQEQAEEFVDSIRRGTSRVSKQLETAGKDLMHRPDQAFGSSNDEDDEMLSTILKLAPEDLEEAYIEIDDGSAKESILL